MSLLIKMDIYRCTDPYQYKTPEHWASKVSYSEEQLESLIKAYKRDLKGCSYWYCVITRVDHDKEDWITTQILSQKNKLKQRIQLNAEAKPKEGERRRVRVMSPHMPVMPSSLSLNAMIQQMETMPLYGIGPSYDGPTSSSPINGTELS